MAPLNQTSCKPGFREIICVLDPVSSQSNQLIVKQLHFNDPLPGQGDDCVTFRAFEIGMQTRTGSTTIGIVKCTYELNPSDWPAASPQSGVERVTFTFHLASALPAGAVVKVNRLEGWIADNGPQAATVVYDPGTAEILVDYDRTSDPAPYQSGKPALQFLLELKDASGNPTAYPGLAVGGGGDLVIITNISG